MQIMMCSNDITFCPALCEAYTRRGHALAAGIPNFFMRLGHYDIVHFHWPEELVGFRGNSADPAKTEPILRLIDWWRERALLVSTVHNLVPHSTDRLDSPDACYYAAFYERMDVIGHFSEYSRRRFSEAYPAVDPAKQVVHGLNRFDHLRPLAKGRVAARQALGLPRDKRIFAVIGAIRKYQEMVLIERAWRAVAGPDDILLFGTRLPWQDTRGLRRTVKHALHRMRLRNRSVHYMNRMLSDPELVEVVEAADAVVLARFGTHLNSGLFPLSMTFGTPLVAPDYGIYSEMLKDDANTLYEPGNAEALAQAIRTQAGKDSAAATAANLARAADFGWDGILERMWPAIEKAQASRPLG